MSARTIQLIVNPAAGASSPGRVRALRSAFEAADARVIMSESLTSRIEVGDGVDHVCVVGGDGTMRHAADAVRRCGRAVTMSVYPAGTVNLLAMECAYSRNPATFAERVLGHEAQRRHYAGLVGDTPFLSCASIGPDSLAVARVSPLLKRIIGRAAYGFAFAGVLWRWPRMRLTLTHAGGQIACEAAYIAKGRYFAGRHRLSRDAAVDQPLFHVLAIERATRRQMLALAWAMLRGRRLDGMAGVTHVICAELSLSGHAAGGAPLPLQADGDIVAHLPATIRLHSQAMAFA